MLIQQNLFNSYNIFWKRVLMDESTLTFESQQIQNHTTKKPIICPQMHLSTLGCMEQDCQNNAFICDDDKCPCQQKHKDCVTLNYLNLIKKINSKKVSCKPIGTLINKKIQEMIDFLSQFQENTKIWIQKEFQYLGLNQTQKELLSSFETGKFSEITGKKILSVIRCKKQDKMQINQFMNVNLQILQQRFQQTKKDLENNLQQIIAQLKTYNKKILQNLNKNILNNILQSKILTQMKQIQTLKKFFSPQKIKSFRLLYRASQNNFSVLKFHQKCDGVPNNLVLVQNQFGKKLGGYTPIAWSSKDQNVYDYSMNTFIFSITNGDKFCLTNKQNATFHDSSLGPTFGGDMYDTNKDLQICNQADKDKDKDSYANINCCFFNKKYQYESQQSFTKFCGNPKSNRFKIKEWQVWKVQFM